MHTAGCRRYALRAYADGSCFAPAYAMHTAGCRRYALRAYADG